MAFTILFLLILCKSVLFSQLDADEVHHSSFLVGSLDVLSDSLGVGNLPRALVLVEALASMVTLDMMPG